MYASVPGLVTDRRGSDAAHVPGFTRQSLHALFYTSYIHMVVCYALATKQDCTWKYKRMINRLAECNPAHKQ